MISLLAICQYFIQATIDVMDKFFITKRRIEPVSYTFFTVATGALVLMLWPWTFVHIPAKFIWLDLLSGAYFALAYYVLFKAVSLDEVTRVVPFVFGLVPVFDILISFVTGRNAVLPHQFAAIFLLIPGALLISYRPGKRSIKLLLLMVSGAFLLSSYNFLWQYAAQHGTIANNFMWNRLGAAAILILLLVVPAYRHKILAVRNVEKKGHTSALFIFKQLLGGSNFIFLSYLLALGNVVIVDSLQGFRYAFLFVFALVLGRKFPRVLDEESSRHIIIQKVLAIILIFLGTILLFLK